MSRIRLWVDHSLTTIKVSNSHSYASFDTLCVQNGKFFEAQWIFEKCLKTVKSLFSKENDVHFEFFRKFRASLTNLDAKGAKRSVKIWVTNFCKSLKNRNILMCMNGRLLKIRSVLLCKISCQSLAFLPCILHFRWSTFSILQNYTKLFFSARKPTASIQVAIHKKPVL